MNEDATVYVPKDSTLLWWNSQDWNLIKGITTLRGSHPLRRARPELFEPLEVVHEAPYDNAPATGAPASKVRADQRGARTR